MYYTNMLVFLSACLSCLSFLSVCLSIKLQWMIHKGNRGQLLNSRVLGVLLVVTLTTTQFSVCQTQSKLSQNHLTVLLLVLLILQSAIASNRCVSRPFQERCAIARAHVHTCAKVFRCVINRTSKLNFWLHVFPT